MRTCSVEDCEKPSRTRGVCDKHYMRALRAGELDLLPPSKTQPRPPKPLGPPRPPKPTQEPKAIEPERIEEARQWFGIDYFYLEKILTSYQTSRTLSKIVTDRNSK